MKAISQTDELKTTQVTIRISPVTNSMWQKLAKEDCRTRTQWLDNIIRKEYYNTFGNEDPEQ